MTLSPRYSLELVLIRVAEYGLQLKSTKCNLFRTSVPLLGHIVGRAGLECDPYKLSAVANWIPPSTIKGVREFLGFTGYYRRFVPDYSTVTQPLVRLLGKGCKFSFSSKLLFPHSPKKTCHISWIQTQWRCPIPVHWGNGTRHSILQQEFEPSTTEILHNQTGTVSCSGHSGPFQGIRLGLEVCRTHRSRRTSLAKKP